MKSTPVKLDEREMIFQEITVEDTDGRVQDKFYICRFFGSHDCWIEAKVFRPEFQEFIFSIPGAWRDAEYDDGGPFRIVSVDRVLEHCPDAGSRAWLEGVATTFDHDNSKGQMEGHVVSRPAFYRSVLERAGALRVTALS